MILCIGATPAVQRVMIFRKLVFDAVNRAEQTFAGAAGKSINVAKVLQALGDRPLATGFLGGVLGEQLRADLRARGIDQDFVSVSAGTRQCATVIDSFAGTQTELIEESRPVARADYRKLGDVIGRHVGRCRAVVMSGTITPGGPEDFYYRCVRLANRAGALSVVDARGNLLLKALKAKPGLAKPNRQELAATVGRPLRNRTAVMRAVRQLVEQGAGRVVVTAGEESILAFDGRTFWKVVPPRIAVMNPIGSGDAFAAGLVSGLLRGEDLGQACRWAAATGAANALTPMPGEVSLADVKRLALKVTAERICG